MYDTNSFIMMPIPAERYADVCALLGGAALAAVASGGAGNAKAPSPSTASPENGASSAATASTSTDTGAAPSGAADQSDNGAGASPAVSDGSGEVDAHGHPWSADLHASTKGKTKDGLWRMKVGVTRPDPKPGFPVDGGASAPATGTSSATDTGSATSQGATDQGTGQPSTPAPETDDDEFAAFRAAADASNATDAAAAASVPARQFSDADLGALCNQAAVKLGDPSPIKEIISKFTPEGQVAHSRNIPAERRDDFAKEVEAKAGIQFAG